MKKYLLALIWLSLPVIGFAQSGSLSPYSYYGYGEIHDPQNVHNAAMGHLNFYTDTTHYNFLMPSSLASLRYVNYSIAQSFYRFGLQDRHRRSYGAISTTPYVSLGIPFGKGGVGLGFRPYSSSGYFIKVKDSAGSRLKTAEGGVNILFVQAGYRIFKGLNVGAGFSYYFGNKIVRNTYAQTGVYTLTRQTDNAFFSGSTWLLSADYTRYFGSYFLQIGARYRLASQIQSQNNRTLQLIDESFGNRRIIQTQTLRDDTTRLLLPYQWNIGAGFGKKNKWFLGVEYEANGYGNYANDFFTTGMETYRNGSAFKLGGYWLPDYRIYSQWWKRMTYKAGFFTRQGILVINNQPINQFGTTFGLSIPLGRYLSNLNIDLEYINRGTLGAGLVKENIFKLKIGFSFNDKWFVKRKIK